MKLRAARTVSWLGLILAVLAPALSGCQPPWAWGFLFAAVLASSACLLFAAGASPKRRGLVLRPAFSWPALLTSALLLWMLGLFIYDRFSAAGAGRLPALSLRALTFVSAFGAALVLGWHWGGSERRLRRAFRIIFLAGVVYASVGVLQWFGIGPANVLAWPLQAYRPSGTYSNANRFAVLLAMTWSCGAALLAAHGAGLWRPRAHPARLGALHRGLPLFGLALGLAVIATGIGFTLSRLTLFALSAALGVSAALGWLKWRRGTPVSTGARLQVPRRLAAVAFLIVPTLAFLALGFTFSGRPLGERVERLADPQQPDWDGRVRAMGIGWRLFTEKPLLGHGLGAFETLFRAAQPLDLPGRWTALHNDWLQLAVELGAPGALLALGAATAWVLFWWQGLRARRPRAFLLRLLGGLAILVPMLCSVADFPLREPANAVLFFFIAGALTAALQRGARAPSVQGASAHPAPAPTPASWRIRALAFVFAFLFIFSGIGAARIGWAAGLSPWRGRLRPPPPKPSDVEDYRAALAIAPRDPELLYPYARTLLASLQAAKPGEKCSRRTELKKAMADMRWVNPDDYRVPWLETALLEEQGAHRKALARLEAAIQRAPAYAALRLQAISGWLRYGVRPSEPFSKARARPLHAALGQMRVLLRADPHYEERFVNALLQAGAMPREMLSLWPGGGADARMKRARLWIRFERWEKAARELAGLAPSAERGPWFRALQGRVALERLRIKRGLAFWQEALSGLAKREDARLERWMAGEIQALPKEAALALSGPLADSMAGFPALAVSLARRLRKENQLLKADRILTVQARRRPTSEGFRCWAELAAELQDRPAALARARQAWELSDRSPRWNRWLDRFEQKGRVAQRRAK